MKLSKESLMEIAKEAGKGAYAPYSDFCVGAALLCSDGKVYTGCNIENASFTPTCCAERVAVFKAVSEGQREFRAIAVYGQKTGETAKECYPCGVCRQVLSEFCSDDFVVITADADAVNESTLGELLPKSFNLTRN